MYSPLDIRQQVKRGLLVKVTKSKAEYTFQQLCRRNLKLEPLDRGIGTWGGRVRDTPPLHPLPMAERDPGAGRIVVEVAQDCTPLHNDGAPTGVGGRK